MNAKRIVRPQFSTSSVSPATTPTRFNLPDAGMPAQTEITDLDTVLLTPAQVAERWSVTEASLERWRSTGEGPKFVKLSRKTIRYREVDMATFIAARAQVSTACG